MSVAHPDAAGLCGHLMTCLRRTLLPVVHNAPKATCRGPCICQCTCAPPHVQHNLQLRVLDNYRYSRMGFLLFSPLQSSLLQSLAVCTLAPQHFVHFWSSFGAWLMLKWTGHASALAKTLGTTL